MQIVSAAGVLLSVVGTIGLFYFGVPGRTDLTGHGVLLIEETDHREVARTVLYRRIARVALVFAIVGGALQFYAAVAT